MLRLSVILRGTAAWIALLGLLVCATHADHDAALDTPTQATLSLVDLVETFFRSDDANQRAALASSIQKAAKGSIETVSQAVQTVKLWPALSQSSGILAFHSAAAGTIDIMYELPAGYDPAGRYPLILCMPDDGASPKDTLALATDILGESIRGFVLIAPAQPVGSAFQQGVEEATDLRRLMRQMRQRIHVDTDRVFLFGLGAGGDAAWMAAIAHPALFSGVIALSSYPPVPYAEQVYSFLLENLRRLPVLTVWTAADEPEVPVKQRAVAAHNRAIVELAKQASLPITGVEIQRIGTRGFFPNLKPPQTEMEAMLTQRRGAPSPIVSHWFRYPAQGLTEWVKQTRFQGDVWEEPQLSILASPTTDRDRFITEVVKSKMGYLGGRIDGQTIEIETRHCARIDLLLPDGLVDFDQPVTVRVNGKKRYSDIIRPDIRTLLETAYQQWEFQRPTLARLSFSVKKKTIP